MRRFLNPFVLVLSLILALGYAYLAARLIESTLMHFLLVLPFLCIWAVPVFYWSRGKESHSRRDDAFLALAYVSMGWLNFLLFLTIARDLLLLGSTWLLPGKTQHLPALSSELVFIASALALGLGLLIALRGPRIVEMTIPIDNLDPALEGLRIAQISDLHVNQVIRRPYVQRVVDKVKELAPDLVVLTGDIVDGSVPHLAPQLSPLAELSQSFRSFLILGNHEYYSGHHAWLQHFRSLGLEPLLNEYKDVSHQGATFYLGGVLDPAAAAHGDGPKPDKALGPKGLRILLAHNPKLASLAAPLGFDLMLSGHTHAGQFFPWNLAVRLVHAPHVVGLSREGSMWVYVNPGTGSWGPPIRLGTRPELSLIRLRRA